MIRLDRGEADKADPDIKLLIAIAPRNPLALYLQALSQAQHKKVSEALATLQKQPALTSYGPAIYLQSVLQYQQNQVEQGGRGTRTLSRYGADRRAGAQAAGQRLFEEERSRARDQDAEPGARDQPG